MRIIYHCPIIVVIALLFITGCNKDQNISPIALLAISLIQSADASKLEVLCVPKEVETMVALYPDLLEKTWKYKITFRDFQYLPIKKDLISAIENSSIVQSNVEGDLRWACIFYNTNNIRILTLYLDGNGEKGLIGGKSITSNGKIVKCLEQRCSSLWK